jgi:hypothetical protein
MGVSGNGVYTQIATLMENMTINHWILEYPIFRQTHIRIYIYIIMYIHTHSVIVL